MSRGARRSSRRVRLASASVAALALGLPALGTEAADAVHVDAGRVRATLEKLGEFGRNPEGGVSRIGFSEADLQAREYVSGLMKDAGLEVRTDAAGNLHGRRAGTESLPTLLFGSHIDSVPHGGNFDGDVGSLGGIEVLRALRDGGVKTRHPLEVVIWSNEEGHHFGLGTLGSGVAAGLLGADIVERKDEDGATLGDWLRRYGQDPSRFLEARVPRGALAAYVELHVEQGPILDESRVPIGVVQGIVGLKRWRCTVTGFANHAGTTPMGRRKDAVATAARDVLAVREAVRSEDGAQVGTVGYVKAEPGAVNVIAGRAEFPVELRDLDARKIDRMWGRIEPRFAETDRQEGTKTECVLRDDVAPAVADAGVQSAIRDAARSAGLATTDLPSGAVQDAQQIAAIAPMGMIFVPSRGGISHSPQELTSWEDVANGTEVLYRTLLLLDERLDRR
jgi:N-carbamoyl-L-amino-acid hydrolase